eukprot:7717471-Prorocentrum_lima.AAC.1
MQHPGQTPAAHHRVSQPHEQPGDGQRSSRLWYPQASAHQSWTKFLASSPTSWTYGPPPTASLRSRRQRSSRNSLRSTALGRSWTSRYTSVPK